MIAALERVRELTDGFGVHSILECVGLEQSMRTALSITRPGGAVGRVGVPQGETMPASRPAFYNNITVSGGPAPVRAYIAELLPDVLEGRIEPRAVASDVTPVQVTITTTGAWQLYDPAFTSLANGKGSDVASLPAGIGVGYMTLFGEPGQIITVAVQ